MAANPPLIVIIDDGLDPFWESLIRNKFSALGATIYELNSREEGIPQVQRILQSHQGPKEVHIYGAKTEAAGELSTSTGYVYTGAQVQLGATTFPTDGEVFLHMTMLMILDESLVVRGLALPPPASMPRTESTPQNDRLNDHFSDQVIDGLGGLDALRYEGPRFRYNLTDPNSEVADFYPVLQEAFPNHLWIRTLVGQDFITNIERLEFSDMNVALDLKDGDSANTALRFLTAIVGKTALQNKALVGEAIAYTDAFETGDLAQLLIDSGVLAQFAGGSSDADLVKLLYANIAGQAPSAAELQWTLDFATGNGFTQADILEFAVGLSQNAPEALLLGQPGIDYLPYALF